MSEGWINIEGELITLIDTPQLLKELNLIQIFLRRFFEKKFIKDIKPSREEQISYQKEFMKREKKWLKKGGKFILPFPFFKLVK